jgi:hypothetical protein
VQGRAGVGPELLTTQQDADYTQELLLLLLLK